MKRKNEKKLISVVCSKCKSSFQKDLKEYNRQIRKNQNYNFFCSLNCSNSKLDEYSSFRNFISTAKKNAKQKKLEFNLDVEFLKELWETQSGKCFYTKLPMLLFPTKSKNEFKPESASLDRVDSSKGYIKGNVRFVCLTINYAKNSFDEKDFVKFLDKI
jgi:hypothetical protein